jgi:hypothetical protein
LTTFSDRILLRWVPVSTLLAAGTTVGLTVGPHPYGYHSWPRPAIENPVKSVVSAPAPAEPLIVAESRFAIRGLPTGGLNRALPPVPASVTGTRSPVGPSPHALPAAAAPPSSPRSGTSQAGGAAGHPRPAGSPRSRVPGPATAATKGDGNGRPSIAAKMNLDDPQVTAASHPRHCEARTADVAQAPAPVAAPTRQPIPPAPPASTAQPATAPAPQADDSAPSGD